MKHTPKTGPVRTLFLFSLGCLLLAAALAVSAAPALAVSWQWQSLEGRERLTVYLDAPGAAKVERTDRTAITVTLPTPPQSVTQAPGSANPAAALVTKVSGQGQNLIISLKAPAFGYITTTPKPGWANADFGQAISRAIGVPVGFDTDVNGAALGEHRWGAAQGLDNFIYLTIGTGIGGGAMVNGQWCTVSSTRKWATFCCPPARTTPLRRAFAPSTATAWRGWPTARLLKNGGASAPKR